MKEGEEIIYKRGKYFLDNNVCVHISKKNGWFLNGYLLSVNSNFLIINEFKEGEIPVFFVEIKEITKYKTKEERDNE